MLRRSPGLASSMAISSVYFPLAPCWLHPPMVWGLIGSECVKRLPPWRPWSPQRHLRRPCCSRGGSGKAPDCFGTDGRPRQPAGHLLVWNIPRKSLESLRDRFLGLEHASACSARDCGFPYGAPKTPFKTSILLIFSKVAKCLECTAPPAKTSRDLRFLRADDRRAADTADRGEMRIKPSVSSVRR